MNLHKTRLAMRIAVMIRNILHCTLPSPLGCLRAIAWWFVTFIASVVVMADSFGTINGRMAEFVVGMFVLLLFTPVLASAWLCRCCNWEVAMIAYGWHIILILILGKAKRKWVQIAAAVIILVQSLVAMYGLCHSI